MSYLQSKISIEFTVMSFRWHSLSSNYKKEKEKKKKNVFKREVCYPDETLGGAH